MVQWIFEAASECPVFSEVIVATDDSRIAEAVAQFDGDYMMTSSEHQTGTDRVAEVARAHPDADDQRGDDPYSQTDKQSPKGCLNVFNQP